jgi:hypothetical protein
VFSLKSTTVIISQEEIDRKMKEENLMKKQIAYLEEFKKANMPTQVFLSAYMRKVLEEALGIIPILSKMVNSVNLNNGNNQNDVNDRNIMNNSEMNEKKAEQSLRNLLSEISVTGVEYEYDANSVLRNISPREQSESVIKVIADLRKQGFNGILIYQSLNEIIKSNTLNKEITLRFSKTLEMTENTLKMIILELCIQYLCMTLPDSQLPQGFDPRKNERRAVFEVFRKKNIITEKSVLTELKDENSENSNDNAVDDKSVGHITTLSDSNSNSQQSSSLPHPSSSSSFSSSSCKLWTKSCPVTVVEDEKRILTFLITYGWEEYDVKYALQIAATLHSTSSSSSSSSSSSTSSSTSISSASSSSTSTNAPQKSSVSTVSTSESDVRDVGTVDTPGGLGPILGPLDLPPLGLTALCVLWFATRYRKLYLTLPLSPVSQTTSSDNQNKNSVEEEIKSIDIIFNNFLAQFINDSKGSNEEISEKRGDKIDEEEGEDGMDETECDIQDEIESLLSIFPDSLQYTKKAIKPYFKNQNNSQNKVEKDENMILSVKKGKSHLLTLSLDRVEGEHNVCAARTYLDVYIIPFLNYPKNVPMMYVRNNAMNSPKLSACENNDFDVKNGEIENSMLLFTQIEIMDKAKECEGDASIFQMSSFLEEKLGLIVSGYESNEEKKKKISISIFLDSIYKYGFVERKINLILSSIKNNNDNSSSVSNSVNNRSNHMNTIDNVSDDATDKTTKESKEHSAEHSMENLKEKNLPSQPTSQSLPTTLTKKTSIPASTSTSNKDLESMSEISSSTMSMKIKKNNKPSFWSVSEKKTRIENVPKSALYLRMAEGRKKLPAHNSRY